MGLGWELFAPGYGLMSVSFQSFVFRHLLITLVRKPKKFPFKMRKFDMFITAVCVLFPFKPVNSKIVKNVLAKHA